MAAVGGQLLAACGATPKRVGGSKSEVSSYNDNIHVRVSTTLEFDVPLELMISRVLDQVLSGESAFAMGSAPTDLRFLIEEPYRIFGQQISTVFSSAIISPPRRSQIQVQLGHSIAAPRVILSNLATGSPSLPSLLKAKAADDYRWTIASDGLTSFSSSSPNKVFSEIVVRITVEQRRGLLWGRTDGDWIGFSAAEEGRNALISHLLLVWPRKVEERFSLPVGSIRILRDVPGRPVV